MVIVRKREIDHISKIIKRIERELLFSVENVMGIYGYGFGRIKK